VWYHGRGSASHSNAQKFRSNIVLVTRASFDGLSGEGFPLSAPRLYSVGLFANTPSGSKVFSATSRLSDQPSRVASGAAVTFLFG
jgi:hypothetical protein